VSAGRRKDWRLVTGLLVTDNGTFVQAIRFILVGLKSNVVYYLLYVALTIVGIDPMVAVVIVFSFSIVYAFAFNRRFVFRSRQRFCGEFVRYFAVYVVALILNLFLLDFGTRKLGYSHFLVQGVLIVAIAVLTFLSLKLFVFADQSNGAERE
jgi:putative flippase GtrA